MAALMLFLAGVAVLPAAAAPPSPSAAPVPTSPAAPAHEDIRAEMTELRKLDSARASRDRRPPAAAEPRRARAERTESAPVRRTSRASAGEKSAPANSRRSATVVSYALAQVGKPYVWAADGPNSFDCSGLVLAAYARVGIHLPHQTGGQVNHGRRVARADLQPGDLVFPSSGHVGIYIGRGRMVHAPKPGDHVRVADIYAFWTARRLL